jgi:YbbR domain-containing protein
VRVRNLDAGLRARVVPATVAVTIRGTADTVDAATADAIEVYVDASGKAAGDHDVELRTGNSQTLTIDNVNPSRVRLRLAKP